MSHVAYICGEKVQDMRSGMFFDYRSKAAEVIYKNTILPEGIEHLDTTEKLWNGVEAFEDKIAEKRYGNYTDPIKQAKSLTAKEKFLEEAVTAFQLEHSMPKEMSLEEHKELSDRIANAIFAQKNLVVQYALHDKKGNPHAHYVGNFRPIIDGDFSKRKVYFLRSDIKDLRKQIADITNIFANERGYDFTVDHRSHLERGIKIEPTKHLGWYASKIKDNSRIVLENQEILSRNAGLLLASPEEMIKYLIENKTVFTLAELKESIKEKLKGDEQSAYVLNELIKKENVEDLIERALILRTF